VSVRVSSPSGAVPSGLTASLINGGTSTGDAALPGPAPVATALAAAGPTTGTAAAITAASTAVSMPTIITRAQWGADESMRPCTPKTLTGFKAAVVHHTVDSNAYASAQAASLMRGIYAYHTQSLGWCDIGYNFLVDRYGRTYEGRKGGVTGFIQGAQAGGFNTETFGVSVIGDYTRIPFSAATFEAVTRVIAWQAGKSNFDPSGTVTLTSEGSTRYQPGVKVVKPRVIGHRDTSLTECPGNTSYPHVASIRSRAASYWAIGVPTASPSLFTAAGPRRVLDTRAGIGAPRDAVGARSAITLTVPGLPAGTTAVVLNVTATSPTADTFVSLYPNGRSSGGTSSLNLRRGQTSATLVTVGVGSGNTVRLYNSAGSVQLVADVAGYYAAGGSGYSSVTPRRVLDTRSGTGGIKGRVGARRTVALKVSGLPAGARAVTMNVTVTNASGNGFLTAYPGGTSRPRVSSVNAVRGGTAANLVTVAVGAGGTVNIYSDSASVDLIADLAGYYAPGTGARFVPISPQRMLDTRTGRGPVLRRAGATEALAVQVPGLPTSASAVSVTMTAVDASATSYIAAYPRGVSLPNCSVLNVVPGATVSNSAAVGVDTKNWMWVYNDAGAVNVIADITGFFTI
ncbi:MAG: peptidoglycan recognition protein, partial [Terracoccus sp.]